MENLESKMVIPAIVLWQNDKWSIEKLNEVEIAIVADYEGAAYCYYDSKQKCLVTDRIHYPKYVEQQALKLVTKYIHPMNEVANIPKTMELPLQKDKHSL